MKRWKKRAIVSVSIVLLLTFVGYVLYGLPVLNCRVLYEKYRGPYSSQWGLEQAAIIRTEAEWKIFMNPHRLERIYYTQDMYNILKKVSIDFNKEMAVIVIHNEGSISTKVKFLKPVYTSGKIIFRIYRNSPGLKARMTASHWYIVAMPKTDLEIVVAPIGKENYTVKPFDSSKFKKR